MGESSRTVTLVGKTGPKRQRVWALTIDRLPEYHRKRESHPDPRR